MRAAAVQPQSAKHNAQHGHCIIPSLAHTHHLTVYSPFLQVQLYVSQIVRLQAASAQAHSTPAVAAEDLAFQDALQSGASSAMQSSQVTCTTQEAQLDAQAAFITAAAVDTVSLLRELPGYLDVSLEDILSPAGQAILPLLFAVSLPSSYMLLLLALQILIYILRL